VFYWRRSVFWQAERLSSKKCVRLSQLSPADVIFFRMRRSSEIWRTRRASGYCRVALAYHKKTKLSQSPAGLNIARATHVPWSLHKLATDIESIMFDCFVRSSNVSSASARTSQTIVCLHGCFWVTGRFFCCSCYLTDNIVCIIKTNHINLHRFSCKACYMLVRIKLHLKFSWQILVKVSSIKFHENPSIERRVVPCRRTDRQTWRS
jgi:hypothetical protein